VESDFFARLHRARPGNRAQYLRVQAVHLEEAGGADRLRAAMGLLDRLLREYPDSIEIAAAHWARGRCLEDVGDVNGAVAALRAALAAERARPNVRTEAYLELGMLAVRHGRKDLHDEALAALAEFGGSELLPRQKYEAAAIRAIVLDARGLRAEARMSALRALDASRARTSGLRHHLNLGLVSATKTPLYADLERIAGNG
jgi:tetratricopeptide (TPR) repeat protein